MRHARVRDLMSTDPVSVPRDASLDTLIALLRSHGFHHVPVVEDGRLTGIVSATDITMLAITGGERPTAGDLMTPLPATIRPDDLLLEAASILGDGQFHALPVSDGRGHLVGMLTTTDLVRFLHANLQSGPA